MSPETLKKYGHLTPSDMVRRFAGRDAEPVPLELARYYANSVKLMRLRELERQLDEREARLRQRRAVDLDELLLLSDELPPR